MKIGDSASLSKTITEADVLLYAAVSMDTNPIHLDAVAAANSRFGERIAHGLLSAGLISACLGTRLPGPGTVYVSQSLEFMAPVKVGSTVTANVKVVDIRERRRVRLETICRDASGTAVLSGEAVVIAPKEERA